MIDDKIIGRCNDYDGLTALLRQRLAELQITYETLDFASGLQSNYSNKVIGTSPVRGLGRVSLGAILQSLGRLWLASKKDSRAAAVSNASAPNTASKL